MTDASVSAPIDALTDATRLVADATYDPVGLARETATLQQAVRGAYAIIAALVVQMGGTAVVTRAEIAASPTQSLSVTPAGDVVRLKVREA